MTAKKWRKKPVVIEAVKWRGDNVEEVLVFTHGKAIWNGSFGSMTIPTLEGYMRASMGDYIIKGVSGEFYPCKPDIFHATYEAVEGD